MSLTPNKKNRRIPKKAVQGRLLLERLFERDVDKGAVFCEISGIQGSGKTSLSLGFADRIIKNNPKEMIYWRESLDSPCQFMKLDSDKWQILSERSFPIQVYEITKDMQPADIKIRYFIGFSDLLRMSKPGMLNVVFFKDVSKWMAFIQRLGETPRWQTCIMDEFEDICPQRCSGELWKRNDAFANRIKQIRKSLISVIGNTQSIMDIDYRVRAKLMMWIYTYGSRVDELSPVSKRAVHSLSIGSAWIDHGHALFGQFKFPPYLPKKRIFMIKSLEESPNSTSSPPEGHV